MMTFKPDKCPDCDEPWVMIEENQLVFSFIDRTDDGDYDWKIDWSPEAVGDSEPVEDEEGKVCVHCRGETDDGPHMHWVEVNPEDEDEVGDEDRKMICITWTEQHSATFSIAAVPDAIYPEDISTLRDKLEGEESFQQVTEVHEWEVVDE